jgi:glucosyl-3-phosphoglycerate synthase
MESTFFNPARGADSPVRAYRGGDLPLSLLTERKQTITVCVPARNEAATIGHIAGVLAGMLRKGLIDQVLVAANNCTDDTAEIARRAGAQVIDERQLMPELGKIVGKGDVLWRALPHCTGDLIVWVDADTGAEFGEHYVTGLVLPLLHDPAVQLVKGIYDKPLVVGGNVTPRREGRVSQLVARPALGIFFRALLRLEQPLSGEMAIRREVAMAVPFPGDYGIEVALLIEIYRRFGLRAFAEADLGVRYNRHQDLLGLQKMAMQVLDTIIGYAIGRFSEGRVIRPPHNQRA